MSFQSEITAVVNGVDGAVACAVMGFDGIAVETVRAPKQEATAEDLDLNSAWIEFANVLSQARTAAELLKVGNLSEVSLFAEKVTTLIRLINSDYFIVLGLLPEGNVGKGRYLLRMATPKLKAEF